MDYINYLASISDLEKVTPEDLRWLLEKSEIKKAKAGEFIFEKGEAAAYMTILLSGEVEVYIQNGNQKRVVGTFKAGTITGILPYSRMKETNGYGKCLQDCEVLRMHKSNFDELIKEHHSLTEALVHLMTTRVRSFTSMQKQNEKLMALGKLSAGLAHELNNPASAILRSAENLMKGFENQPKNFKEVITLTIDEDIVDHISQLVIEKSKSGVVEMPMMVKSEKEDEWAEWLERIGAEDAYTMAETFVDYGIELEEVNDSIGSLKQKDSLSVLSWIDNVLNTEKLVSEIQEASKRISTLIQSVKTYTHMDKGADKEDTKVESGINSTLTMLNHKIKRKQIFIEKVFEDNTPTVNAVVGELNQIWTNILDNAIDAVPDKDGKISIRTYSERKNVKIDIEDNGSGIAEDVIGKIFDPFFTTKKIGEGTGLGLDIVKKIIDQHQGSIDLVSEPGKTVFTLCFPKSE